MSLFYAVPVFKVHAYSLGAFSAGIATIGEYRKQAAHTNTRI